MGDGKGAKRGGIPKLNPPNTAPVLNSDWIPPKSKKPSCSSCISCASWKNRSMSLLKPNDMMLFRVSALPRQKLPSMAKMASATRFWFPRSTLPRFSPLTFRPARLSRPRPPRLMGPTSTPCALLTPRLETSLPVLLTCRPAREPARADARPAAGRRIASEGFMVE